MLNMRSVLEPRLARTQVTGAGAGMLTLGIDLFLRGIHREDLLLRANREALGRGMGPRSDKGDGDPNQDPDPPMA